MHADLEVDGIFGWHERLLLAPPSETLWDAACCGHPHRHPLKRRCGKDNLGEAMRICGQIRRGVLRLVEHDGYFRIGQWQTVFSGQNPQTHSFWFRMARRVLGAWQDLLGITDCIGRSNRSDWRGG